MALVIDIESVPKPHAEILAAMPDAIKNPFCPEAIRNPVEPDWKGDCPAYSLPGLLEKQTAARAEFDAIKSVPDAKGFDKIKATLDKADAAVTDAEAKRAAWIKEKSEAWKSKNSAALAKFNFDADEARLKFIGGAALDARLCHVKLIGVRDTWKGSTTIFVFEPDKAKVEALIAFAKKGHRGKAVIIAPAMLEKQNLKAFFASFQKAMNTARVITREGLEGGHSETLPDCVTYFGNTWDFPLMYRKAWILGLPIEPMFRRGRYFTDRMIDLHELWQMGDNRLSVGGLDGLAAALDVPVAKLGDGASFHKFYDADPTDGLAYLLGDLDVTEESARRMGVSL